MNRHINACMLGHEHTFQSMHACLRMCHVPGGSQGPLDQMPYCTLTHMVNQAPYPYYTSGPRDSFNLRVSNPNLKVMLAAHNLQCQKRPSFSSPLTRNFALFPRLLHGNSFLTADFLYGPCFILSRSGVAACSAACSVFSPTSPHIGPLFAKPSTACQDVGREAASDACHGANVRIHLYRSVFYV